MTLQEIIFFYKEKLSLKRKIVIITHYNPDGDAIGSSLGLYHFLKNLDQEVTVITPNQYPSFLQWLEGNDKVLVHSVSPVETEQSISKAEIIILLDFNSIGRLEKVEKFVNEKKTYKLLIDHHPNPEDIADHLISDTSASSASELVYNFMFQVNKDGIDKVVAECIFTGIITDTGGFSYNSSNPATYEIVAQLLRYGIDKDKIYRNVYDSFTENRMNLLGFALNQRLKLMPEYKTGYIYLTTEDLNNYNFDKGDSEGFVNYPLSIKDIVFSVLFIELKDHIKISFRSKGNFDVNVFARNHFFGGGHKNASGGKIFISLKEAINHFEEKLPLYKVELLNSLSNSFL